MQDAPAALPEAPVESLNASTQTVNAERHSTDPNVIASAFPSTSFSGESAEECSICLIDFEEGELLRVLPSCDHRFHHDCVRELISRGDMHCPLCRRDYGIIVDLIHLGLDVDC
ncbi:PREDICTED: probable E3 ubiquitin-protein ligase ATL45 [Nicotiana attenuata]|uniref:RING-type E3 ubiquitin transferase n=1 Tax=Nicotiana attenuata TaxID=49451 RepID=A0A1J6JQ76_NICAT|nr:PREDICTED: probable E3 ubiquitin-protein ligase ATL45 [Nicotiana attenuata]OIT19398.1 ring-h2 finger protein atl2 [Nicotiana attenuata]